MKLETLLTGETGDASFNHSYRFLKRLLEISADRHHFADRLHAGADRGRHHSEFLRIPSRDLDDKVIQGGLEARRGYPGYRISELRQRITERKLRRDMRQRIACGFGCQSRTSA